MNTKNSVFCQLRLCIITCCICVSCGQTAKINTTGIKLNYPPANYSGIGWLSETELTAFVADEDGSVIGYYLENDETLYSIDLPPFVAKLDCNEANDFNTGINYAQTLLSCLMEGWD